MYCFLFMWLRGVGWQVNTDVGQYRRLAWEPGYHPHEIHVICSHNPLLAFPPRARPIAHFKLRIPISNLRPHKRWPTKFACTISSNQSTAHSRRYTPHITLSHRQGGEIYLLCFLWGEMFMDGEFGCTEDEGIGKDRRGWEGAIISGAIILAG